MLARIIENQPLILITAWIIILIISSPLVNNLNSIVQSNTENFLPPTAESVRASKELSKIMNETGSNILPEYIIVVQGVPINYSTYNKLKNNYIEYKDSVDGEVYSWIDIIYNIDKNLSRSYTKSINDTIKLIYNIYELNEKYNLTLESIMNLTILINNTDYIYSNLLKSILPLNENIDNLSLIVRVANESCTILLPAVTTTYTDVIRAEALLESLTNAYATGVLTEEDLNTVINASNVHPLQPLSPGLVVTVFNSVYSIGGPSNFSNQVAVRIVEEILRNSTLLSPSTQPILDLVIESWGSIVSSDVDHRLVVSASENLAEGQLELVNRTSYLMIEVREILSYLLAESFAPSDDPLIVNITKNILDKLYESNCNAKIEEVLEEALIDFFVTQGLPLDVATLITTSILNESFDNFVAVSAAINIISSLYNITISGNMEELLANTITLMDPDGNYSLVGPRAVSAATIIVASGANITLSNEDIERITALGDAEYAAYVIIRSSAGNFSVIVDLLWTEGLLGKGRSEVLEGLEGLLPELLERQGVPDSIAVRIVNASFRVFSGEDLDSVVYALVEEDLNEAFSDIVESLRGVIVSKDYNGFLVLYWAPETINDSIQHAITTRDALREILSVSGLEPEVVVLGGEKYMNYEAQEAALADIERSDRLSALFVILVLTLVLESVVAVLLPFVGIGFGLAAAMAIVYILGVAGFVDVTTHSRTIMFSTGLGLGIDYAAYVAKRFREALSEEMNPRRAAAEAYRRSLRPVVAGASAAIIGFGSMILAKGFPLVSSIGTNVPIAIALVMAASLTFIPALLAIVGGKSWFWWPRARLSGGKASIWVPVGDRIASKPMLGIVIVVVLTIASIGVAQGFEGSYDLSLNLPPNSESRLALDIMREHYEPGAVYPLYVIPSDPALADSLAQAVEGLDCVSKALVPEDLGGRVIQVILSVDPTSSAGLDCADEVRSISHSMDPGSLVGGISAVNLDLRDTINREFYGKVYPTALILMFATIAIAYGGLMVALASVLAVSLAALWATATAVVIYEWLFGLDVLWFLPIIVFTAILGVGMDYNSFFLARAREECWANCSRKGVSNAVARAAGLVVGLALIMASAYLGLALAETPGLSQMGLALVLGVVFAGANAALILTPPVLSLLGRRAWWPSKPRPADGAGG